MDNLPHGGTDKLCLSVVAPDPSLVSHGQTQFVRATHFKNSAQTRFPGATDKRMLVRATLSTYGFFQETKTDQASDADHTHHEKGPLEPKRLADKSHGERTGHLAQFLVGPGDAQV